MARKVRIKIPAPVYALIDVPDEDAPSVLVVNEALLLFRHRDIFGWHLQITIEAKDVGGNGMPSPAERRALDRLGEKLESIVLAGKNDFGADNAIFLGRSTGRGLRQLFYQVNDPDVAHVALQSLVTKRRPAREWAYEMQYDEKWTEGDSLLQLVRRLRHK
jgi:hypothetical protein